MKRNGNNIIFSDDVTIEKGSNKGKNLSDILEAQDKAIKELRSNVKWIYQYGGVGSGSGGGGTSSSWSISATLDKKPLGNNLDPIILPKAGSYSLYIHINSPQSDKFAVTYSYKNSNVTETRYETLSLENGWTLNRNIFISGNDTITISVKDGNEVEKIIARDYITNAYSFNCFFADDNGIRHSISDDSLFISTINTRGLKVAIDYYLATSNLGTVTYSYTNFNGAGGSSVINYSDKPRGTILLDAFSENTDVNEDSAGNYKFTIEFTISDTTIPAEELKLNLIPDGLYLKVVPETGTIYKDEQSAGPDLYQYDNGVLYFFLTAYNGSSNNAGVYQYAVSIDDVPQHLSNDLLNERKTSSCALNFTNAGEHKVEFTIHDPYESIDKKYTYWVYTKEIETSLQWYPIDDLDDVHTPIDRNEYKNGVTAPGQGDFVYADTGSNVNEIITMYANSNERVINITNKPKQPHDCLICVGIQYNTTNDDTKPILTIQDKQNANPITIYQNKIVRGTTTLGSMYLGKEDKTYGANEASNYHLISIYRRFIRKEGNTHYSELCVYMDGVLELVYPSYITAQETYKSINLKPSNYFINLLEVSYFNHNNSEAEKFTYMTDAGIVRYWYTYKRLIQRINIEKTNIDLLKLFETGFTLTDDNHVKVNNSTIESIAKSTNVPILLLKYDESEYNPHPAPGQTSIPTFMDWSDRRYIANGSDDSIKLDIGVAWGSGGSEIEDIKVDSIATTTGSEPIRAKFTLDIQGSTTRAYHAKNYTLGIEATDSTGGYVPLFSPRFDSGDKNTYLPEKAFTLKADVVDSSHSNNTSMGAFVNANTTKFAVTGDDPEKYKKYVKNCLTGFPILVFVQINNASGTPGETECYYLGIYNCNLGRSSFFNLGYCATSNLPENLEEGFCVCAIPDSAYNLKPGLIVSEISDNNKFWDFSEYHSTILFSIGNEDTEFMFDDTVSGRDKTHTEESIQEFVRHTARAGGYVFESISKGMGTHEKGYKEIGKVPNVYVQYKKDLKGDGITYDVDPNTSFPKPTQNDLVHYIHGQDETTTAAYVNFDSLVEYYTVCMAFGLLDSVQKNLNIKTWNSGGTFYFAFYDMDTCLGIDNDGNDSTYFAFSDFWEDESTVNKEDDSYYDAKPVKIYRDYFDKDKADGIVGFDIPSSYAFAVAKYAKAINNRDNFLPNNDKNLSSPQDLWATWRQSKGPLENADKFIDVYYSGYMKDVDELMFNFNYRHKYLFIESNATAFGNEIKRFKGRRISYVREWLNGRLHILDAYFNIVGDKSITISDGTSYTEDGKKYVEPNPEPSLVDRENKDIYVITDIFGATQSFQGDLNFMIKAPDYSPLIIQKSGSQPYRYLLKKSTNLYNVNLKATGTNKWVFGGSSLWTFLDSINSFVSQSFNIDTTHLTTLNGTRGTVFSWNLKMPALQEVSLTSKNYQGELIFDASETDKFPNLNSINISGSQIKLYVYGENVKTVTLRNVKTQSVELINCKALSDVYFGSSAIDNCFINPIWDSSDISLIGNHIRLLTLGANPESNANLTIDDDDTLEELTLTNFKTVTIGLCPKLNRITVNGTNITSLAVRDSDSATKLKTVIINSTSLETLNLGGCESLDELFINGTCNNLTTFNIGSTKLSKITYNNIDTADETLLDLSPMGSLSDVTINNNTAVTKIRFANNIDKPIPITHSFKNCSNLERVYGNLIIGCSECFSNLTKFSIHGSTDDEKWGTNKKKTDGGVVRMPIEILSNISTDTANHDDIVREFNKLFDLINSGLNRGLNRIFYKTKAGWWQEGNSVTNIQFDRNTKNVLYYICYNTSCTQFDIYYILNALALSNMAQTATQDATRSFYGTYHGNENRFKFSEGNQPNRYMFYGCSTITNISDMITAWDKDNPTNPEPTKFTGPDHDNNDIVTYDNGLISPLINLKTFSRLFNVGGYISRFFFRRTTGNYSLTSISHQTISLIHNDIDSLNYSGVNLLESRILSDDSVREKMGDMTDFFKDLPYLTSITSICSPRYLDYDTLVIPSSNITHVINSFNTTYGRGTIDLQGIFTTTNRGKLKTLTNSFKVSNADTNHSYNQREDVDGKVDFPITSGMFTGFTQLQYIGYHYVQDNSGGVTEIDVNYWTTTSVQTGFNGNGLRKYINQNDFPYDIFKPCETNLINCSGLFQGIQLIEGGAYAPAPTDYFKFPGTLFSGCTKLKNVAAFLKNCDIPYTLTSGGFSNCPELENITQIFYHEVTGRNISKLRGQIPTKLFYHGHFKRSKNYVGTNNDEDMVCIDGSWKPKDGFDQSTSEHNSTVWYAEYRRNIKFAFQAFYGCGYIEEYVGDYTKYDDAQDLINSLKPTDTDSGGEWGDNVEYVNTSYIPFKYYYINDDNKWEKREGIQKEALIDISRIYDGNQIDLKGLLGDSINQVFCYEDINEDLIAAPALPGNQKSTLNFFCAPDLLSYMSNDQKTNVIGMFKWCGSGEKTQGNDIPDWMKGRICPYLLAYLDKITNLSEFFYNCKGLSSLANNDLNDKTYLIPKKFFENAINITTLNGTFQGVYFGNKPDLDVFGPLSKQKLDIRGIFAACRYSQETSYTITGIFRNNKLIDIAGAFSYKTVSPTKSSERVIITSGTYTFENINLNISWNNNFPDLTNSIKEAAIQYLYYGYDKAKITEDSRNIVLGSYHNSGTSS